MKRKEEQKRKKQEEARLQRMGSGVEEERIQKRKYMSADALDDE